ncbi:MAG: tRNA 2-selenouridine(34) synthase MnmH [Firmicutes bacterium]|nr:tRNA 2-selenouridine(34) synthase MnmH [Bacillota bacterium]
MKEASYTELCQRDDVQWIDVRSPGEFAESAIPGSVNIPLFDDEERALVGTVYKQESPELARELGLDLYGGKLRDIVALTRKACDGRVAAVYCWRGGMRSKAVTTVLELMGVPTVRLTGGYRAYREFVTKELAALGEGYLPPVVVLHGMTGVGKTMLLQRLDREGLPVVDLEAMARHRGSVFGGIGLTPANQRQFDSALWQRLQGLKGAPYLLVEAESKRIGRVTMPDGLYQAKLGGRNFELTASLAIRVERTLMQYRLDDADAFADEIRRAVDRIEKRFSPDLRRRAYAYVEQREYRALFGILLDEYYDPRYRHAMSQYQREFEQIDGEDLDRAAHVLMGRLGELYGRLGVAICR